MSEQFVLRWHYQEFTLLKNLPCFFDAETLCDCTISVDSHNLKAHRLVLAMCSVYFFQLFQEMGNSHHPVIVLNNVNLADIEAVLAFIYRGQCIVSKDQLPSLLSVAKLLKIQGLCDMKVPEKNVQIDQTTNNNDNKTLNINSNQGNNNLTINNDETKYKCDSNSPVEKSSLNNRHQNNYIWDKSTIVSSTLDSPPTLNNNRGDLDQNASVFLPRKPPKDTSETCKCFLCGKYLSNQYNLRVHMETHEEAYHACQSCPHVSRSRDALRKHVSYRHPEEYHTRKRKKID